MFDTSTKFKNMFFHALGCHTVDVTPPQAATKIMAGMAEQRQEWRPNSGMAEWRNGGWNGGMAERMAEWSNGGNGGMAEWQNGGMAEWGMAE
jgi:hypothetical protein